MASEPAADREHRVTPLELFFDLVFVFALTQVTALMSADPTWPGVLHGMLVLAALWWAWAAYAWLTNTLDPEEGAVRIAMFAAMAAMLVAALAAPQAFGEDGVLFGVAYLFVRTMHLALYAIAAKRDPDLLGAVLRMVPSSTISGILIVAAGFLDPEPRAALWLVALAIDYGGVLLGRGQGWRVTPGHFAERHGLIVIIALGESIVAVGVGAAGLPLDVGVVTAALLGIVVAAALWWAYFDWLAIVAERLLEEAQGAARAVLARDAYSYLHLPMIAGVILFALAMKKTLEHVSDPLEAVPAFALCGGLAVYLLAYVALGIRVARRISRGRLVAGIVLFAFYPVSTELPALGALAVVTAVATALIAYEAIRHREERLQIRAARAAA